MGQSELFECTCKTCPQHGAGTGTNKMIAAYAEAFKARYGINPPITKKDAGIAKRLVSDLGWLRATNFVTHYLKMPNEFFALRRHDLVTFEQNLKNIAVDFETGQTVTRQQARQGETQAGTVGSIRKYLARKRGLPG